MLHSYQNTLAMKKELIQNKARIGELEDILKSIQDVIINNDNVRVQAKQIGSDLAVQLLFERVEKALSDRGSDDTILRFFRDYDNCSCL